MNSINTILQSIGNTSLVELSRVVPTDCARIFAKLEWENPTGSMKDRAAQAMISKAEEDSRLQDGFTVVEYTGGSTGISLALMCVVRGYPLKIITSDAFSEDKRIQMASLGAELIIVPSEGGKTTKRLILNMIETAREISQQPQTYWTNQLYNIDSIEGYYRLGDEIWNQTVGKVDAFVHAAGTAASIRGVGTVLKRYNEHVKIVVVEPGESPVLSGGEPGPHKIEGVGIGYTPPLWDESVIDEIIPIGTEEAKAMTRKLAKEEGLFAGTSSGANVLAAIEVGKKLGPDATVVTLMVDSGLKYLSTDVYQI